MIMDGWLYDTQAHLHWMRAALEFGIVGAREGFKRMEEVSMTIATLVSVLHGGQDSRSLQSCIFQIAKSEHRHLFELWRRVNNVFDGAHGLLGTSRIQVERDPKSPFFSKFADDPSTYMLTGTPVHNFGNISLRHIRVILLPAIFSFPHRKRFKSTSCRRSLLIVCFVGDALCVVLDEASSFHPTTVMSKFEGPYSGTPLVVVTATLASVAVVLLVWRVQFRIYKRTFGTSDALLIAGTVSQ